jgi:hypothetical protein
MIPPRSRGDRPGIHSCERSRTINQPHINYTLGRGEGLVASYVIDVYGPSAGPAERIPTGGRQTSSRYRQGPNLSLPDSTYKERAGWTVAEASVNVVLYTETHQRVSNPLAFHQPERRILLTVPFAAR